jgi:RNA polymerase sigma factor (sigma-70 family)
MMNFAYYRKNDDISFTLLTFEQEKALFDTFYNDPDPVKALAARDHLIQCHLKHVARLAIRYAKRAMNDDEAISAGNAALLQALESRKWKPEFGVRFSSYVRQYVRGQVLAQFRRSQPVGDYSGYGPLPRIPEDAVVTGALAVALATCDLKLHPSWVREIEDPKTSEAVERMHLRESLSEAFKRLHTNERAVIEGVFYENKTIQQVATTLGVSRQAAHQNFNRGLDRLRLLFMSQLSPYLGDVPRTAAPLKQTSRLHQSKSRKRNAIS